MCSLDTSQLLTQTLSLLSQTRGSGILTPNHICLLTIPVAMGRTQPTSSYQHTKDSSVILRLLTTMFLFYLFFSFVSFAFEGIQGLFLALSFCPSFTMLGIELELAAYGLSALNSICLYHLCIYKWGKDKMSFCHTIKIKL